MITGFKDLAGNDMIVLDTMLLTTMVDTKAPSLIAWNLNTTFFDETNAGGTWMVQAQYDEPMMNDSIPSLLLPISMDLTPLNEQWLDPLNFEWSFVINDNNVNASNLILSATGASDLSGNMQDTMYFMDGIQWEMNPWVEALGCIDTAACNFDVNANTNDGSCIVPLTPCDDGDSLTVNDMIQLDCSCSGEIVQALEEQALNFSIYPNPTTDFLNINGTGRVIIFDVNGRVLFDQWIVGRAAVDVQKWAAGSYTLKTHHRDFTWIKSNFAEK
jgi:hypothetical protein